MEWKEIKYFDKTPGTYLATIERDGVLSVVVVEYGWDHFYHNSMIVDDNIKAFMPLPKPYRK